MAVEATGLANYEDKLISYDKNKMALLNFKHGVMEHD
jgi:hypothetical protein